MIGFIINPIINFGKEISDMEVSREEIEYYLQDVKSLCSLNKYRVEMNDKRQDNRKLRTKYVVDKQIEKEIIMSLEVEDFSKKTKNTNGKFDNKYLYVFGRDVKLLEKYGEEEKVIPLYIKIKKYENTFMVLISFHEANYPIKYYFK